MPHIWRQAFLGAIHSFQRSLVVKHTDTAWLFPTFIAFQVVVSSVLQVQRVPKLTLCMNGLIFWSSWTLPLTAWLIFLALLTLLLMVLFSLLISYTHYIFHLEVEISFCLLFSLARLFSGRLSLFFFCFSILSADVIYTRNFDSITLQQQAKRQEQHWIPRCNR